MDAVRPVIGGVIPLAVTFLSLLRTSTNVRTWKTLYMDDEDSCQIYVRNDDLAEGDKYLVKSDSWQGHAPWARRPAECTVSINYGDRLVAVNLVDRWCDQMFKDPFVAIYDTCLGDRSNLLARFNCSSTSLGTIYSTGTCLSIYHYRGHTRWGYFFSLEVVAKVEVIAFPAGGIAAIIIIAIVVIMVIVKIFCVVSGYENQIPVTVTSDDPEDPKHTLLGVDTSSGGGAEVGQADPPPGQGAASTSQEGSSHQEASLTSGSSRVRIAGKSYMTSDAAFSDRWDRDADSDYSPPKLKTFCSGRGTGILKL